MSSPFPDGLREIFSFLSKKKEERESGTNCEIPHKMTIAKRCAAAWEGRGIVSLCVIPTCGALRGWVIGGSCPTWRWRRVKVRRSVLATVAAVRNIDFALTLRLLFHVSLVALCALRWHASRRTGHRCSEETARKPPENVFPLRHLNLIFSWCASTEIDVYCNLY